MKDVVVKSVKANVCNGVVSINDKEYKVNSTFSLMSKIYNEMYDTSLSFGEIVKKYISQSKNTDELKMLKSLIEAKL